MRFLLRPLLLYLIALAILTKLVHFAVVANDLSLVLAAFTLFILNILFRPILKILLIPINLITLGLFSWIENVVIIFVASLLVPGFHILKASFAAWQIGKYAFPEIHLTLIWSYLLFSFLLSITIGFLEWLLVERE